ncbi:hypothetical protein D3C73_1403990 [compost metagenome]
MFNVAEKTVRKRIDEGKLFAVHLGGTTVRIPEIELHQFYILSHGRRGLNENLDLRTSSPVTVAERRGSHDRLIFNINVVKPYLSTSDVM